MPDIELREISKHYSALRAVHNANLKIKDGEYVVLLGPSGCGKTTLLKMIAGIIKPNSGQVFISKKDVTDLPPEDRELGFVFQNYALFPHLSARLCTLRKGSLHIPASFQEACSRGWLLAGQFPRVRSCCFWMSLQTRLTLICALTYGMSFARWQKGWG
ncbi:MAG: ATP-binding cassette domain-containing protein [Candidatus Micrarchaeota archaeon]|nr:ATP-binding cassette domain-containing protein [Candidatus Micrarchaeota archaeon]